MTIGRMKLSLENSAVMVIREKRDPNGNQHRSAVVDVRPSMGDFLWALVLISRPSTPVGISFHVGKYEIQVEFCSRNYWQVIY